MSFGLHHRPLLQAAAALAAAAGVAAWLLGLEALQAALVGWCLGAAFWLAAVTWTLARTAPEGMRQRAGKADEGKWAVLGASLAAAVASVAAVVTVLAAPGPEPAATLALCVATIALSWTFVHVLFAAHYAHDYWLAGGGIDFPGQDQPDFAEFLYFAFTVGMTFQVSDVTTTASGVRRLVLLHGVVAFVFNAVILATAVNLAGNLLR